MPRTIASGAIFCDKIFISTSLTTRTTEMRRNGEFGTKHTFATKNPQSYCTHGKVAWKGGWKMLGGAFASWIHAAFPEWKRWQFWASTLLIEMVLNLWRSGRH